MNRFQSFKELQGQEKLAPICSAQNWHCAPRISSWDGFRRISAISWNIAGCEKSACHRSTLFQSSGSRTPTL